MNINQLTYLLYTLHRHQPSATARLASLENDVWRGIARRKMESPGSILERITAMVLQPQYTPAFLACALTVALYATIIPPAPQYPLKAVEALNFSIFSSRYTASVVPGIAERL